MSTQQLISEIIRTATGAIVVSASAGSGKTYQLTQRFLHLLSQPESRIQEIVALTFTDAAAGEMKNRIYSALIEATENETDIERKNLFLTHRLQFASNRISTIHSFCQSILKENPEALAELSFPLDPFDASSGTISLDSGFSLLDGFNEKAMTPKWRAEFLRHYFDDESLARWLTQESTTNLEKYLALLLKVDDAILSKQAEIPLETWKQLVKEELNSRFLLYEKAKNTFLDLAKIQVEIFSIKPSVFDAEWADDVCGLKKVKLPKIAKPFKEAVPVELDDACVAYVVARNYFLETIFIPLGDLLQKPKNFVISSITPDSEFRFGRMEFAAWQQVTDMAKTGARWKTWLRFQRFKNRFIDHDDSILLAGMLLEKNPTLAKRYQLRFKHIMVDEPKLITFC